MQKVHIFDVTLNKLPTPHEKQHYLLLHPTERILFKLCFSRAGIDRGCQGISNFGRHLGLTDTLEWKIFHSFAALTREFFATLKEKFRFSARLCNILYEFNLKANIQKRVKKYVLTKETTTAD